MSAISVGNLVTIHRLQRRGLSLCPDAGLMPRRLPIWQALAAPLSGNGAAVVTYVDSSAGAGRGREEGFLQLRPLPGRQTAEMLYIAPAPAADGDVPAVWDTLLARAANWAAAQGVLRVLAAVPAEDSVEAVFRRNGYWRYAAETVYQRSFPRGAVTAQLPLRPSRERDRWAMQRLHAAVTPLRVQQAEGHASLGGSAAPSAEAAGWSESLVLVDNDGIAADLRLRRGSAVHWIRLELRPDAAEHAPALVQEALALVSRWPERPVRCAVRHYQEQVPRALREWGFEPQHDRALTVRHSVLSVRPALEEAVQRLQGALSNGLHSTLPESSNSVERSRPAPAGCSAAREWSHDRSSHN